MVVIIKMSTQVMYLRAIHILRQSEDVDMPAIMEHMCMEIVGTKPGDFNWERLDEPASEQEDEMEELDAPVMSYEEAQPSKDKGKAKVTVFEARCAMAVTQRRAAAAMLFRAECPPFISPPIHLPRSQNQPLQWSLQLQSQMSNQPRELQNPKGQES